MPQIFGQKSDVRRIHNNGKKYMSLESSDDQKRRFKKIGGECQGLKNEKGRLKDHLSLEKEKTRLLNQTSPTHNFERYTLTTMELKETVMEIIHENKEKYYLFHDDQGHLT